MHSEHYMSHNIVKSLSAVSKWKAPAKALLLMKYSAWLDGAKAELDRAQLSR